MSDNANGITSRPVTLAEALAVLKARHTLSPAEHREMDRAIAASKGYEGMRKAVIEEVSVNYVAAVDKYAFEKWLNAEFDRLSVVGSERGEFEDKPAAWLIVRHSGTGGASARHLEVVLSPLTDDTYMDEGDEAWPLYAKKAKP